MDRIEIKCMCLAHAASVLDEQKKPYTVADLIEAAKDIENYLKEDSVKLREVRDSVVNVQFD